MDTIVAILTSGKLDKLERCIQSVLGQTKNIVVIINTLDEEYIPHAQRLSSLMGIPSIVTPSNGKPGKGKNSLIEYFLTTEFTHVIPVDGDDYLMPNAVSILEHVANRESADVIGLIDALALLDGSHLMVEDWLHTDVYLNRTISSINEKDFKKFNLHIEKIRRVSTEHGNFFNRLVLLSKAAASLIDYEEEMGGAEDVKQSLLLKLAHNSQIIRYVLLSSKNVYVHDVSDTGVFFNVLCKCDPDKEKYFFWKDLPREQINTLKSFELECVYEQDGI